MPRGHSRSKHSLEQAIGAATSESEDSDLYRIQADSQAQRLPDQDRIFSVAKRVRSKLNNLPDPTKPPLGFVPGRGFDVVFPFINLPHLTPNLNGDWVQFGSPHLEPNRLYYGDNLQVLRTLPTNSIDLIYIDPPFFSGAEYNVIWGDTNEVRTFSDIWEGGLDTYLIWLNARLWEMCRVLKETGSMCVHCDWHASHYIKGEMDKIFGYDNLRNEIIWGYHSGGASSSYFGRKHDVLLWYAKRAETCYFNDEPARTPYTDSTVKAFNKTDDDGRRYKLIRHRNGTEERVYPTSLERGRLLTDVWEDIPHIANWSGEKVGYPTQKPEALLERITSTLSPSRGLVADFFVGGGTTAAVAQRLGRRWIACDSSRIAVAVTLDRLVKLGEEQSGVMSNYGRAGSVQTRLDLPDTKAAIPDIRVHYVGVYPMDRFKAVEQPQFTAFILKCLAAQADTSDSAISGWRTAREPLLVGPADPDVAPDPRHVQAFFEDCLKRLQPNLRTIARVVCWRASPELLKYRSTLHDYVRRNVQPRGADLDLDFLFIGSEEFRERIRAKYPDTEGNEFFLRFTKEPVIGEIVATKLGPRRYGFEARDAASTNAGGYLVNCQWDFGYQRGHFAAHKDYILGRKELKGKEARVAGHKFEAVLEAEHTFDRTGEHVVGCRVQDNLGAEAIRTLVVEV